VQSVDSEVNFAVDRAKQRNALAAGFLGWTLDAFDFFVLTYVLGPVAHDFRLSIPDIALTLTASLAMRPVGAFIFGLMADRYGRRLPMALDVAFYTVVEVLSGIAPNYATFFVLRLLYGIGMGGEWGVGASLAMESVSAQWRGTLSGLLQEGYAFGSLLAAMAYYVVFPRWGWRPLFFIGAVPAAVTLLVLARVRETEAWRQSRTGWAAYRSTMFQNWKLFLYLVLLMTMMNFMSHGTQDLYPTFLQRQRHFDARLTATTSMISMAGAIFGGLAFGWYSDRRGRRRAMVTATLLAALLTPLWILAPNLSLIALGAFLIQFMVQGAWGVIPAHINELSPASLRGFFPGFAYQLGVLCASSVGYVEAVLGEHFSYAPSMGILAATALLAGAAVIALGPEAHAVKFSG